MKGNDGTGNIEERDTWETPKWLFDILDNQYNFNFDCCANKDNTKCKSWSDDFENCNKFKDFRGWMNPPFSIAERMFKRFFKVIIRGVAIYRDDNNETKLWQQVIYTNATWVFKFEGRLGYEGKVGKGSRFPSALIGYNVPPPKGLKGTLLIIDISALR